MTEVKIETGKAESNVNRLKSSLKSLSQTFTQASTTTQKFETANAKVETSLNAEAVSIEKAAKAVSNFEKGLKANISESEKLLKNVKALEASAAAYKERLDKLNKSSSKTTSQQSQLGWIYIQLQKNMQAVNQTAQEQSQRLIKLNETLIRKEKVIGALQSQLKKYASDVRRLSTEVSVLADKNAQYEKSLAKSKKMYQDQVSSLQKMGALVRNLATAYFAAHTAQRVFMSVVGTGVDFERQMAIVGGVTRTASIENGQVVRTQAFMDLQEKALELGAKTEYTSRQAAEAMQYLSMAGFTANQTLATIGGTLDLATAGFLEMGEAAELSTNALTAMGLLTADQIQLTQNLERVNHTLVAVTTRTNTNVRMIAESFKYVAPKARAMGEDIESLVSWIGILGNVGIQGCYDSETEVLTQEGWKRWEDVTEDDVFATVNPYTHALEYHKATKLIAYRHTGKMWKIINRSVDLLVTPNHNMYVKRRGSDSFELLSAEDSFGKSIQFISSFERNFQEDVSTYTIEGFVQNRGSWNKVIEPKTFAMDDFLELLGFYLSEGSCDKDSRGNYQIRITQKKPHIRAKIEDCLNRCGIKYKLSKPNNYTFFSQQLYNYFVQFGKQPYRFIPSEFKSLSTRQSMILFTSLMEGDGCNNTYYTTSKQLADDVQEICLKMGLKATIKLSDRNIKRKDGEPTLPIYHVHVSKLNRPKFIPSEYKGVHGDRLDGSIIEIKNEWVDYDGMVYCAEVPPNHVLMVRRNGKAVACGNSMAGTQLAFAYGQMNKVFNSLNVNAKNKTFIDMLKEVNKQGWTAVDVEANFTERAGRAVNALRYMIPYFKDLKNQITGTADAHKNLASIMRQTTWGNIKELQSVWEGIQVKGFLQGSGAFNEAIKSLTQSLSDNSTWLSNLAEDFIYFGSKMMGVVERVLTPIGLLLGALEELGTGLKIDFVAKQMRDFENSRTGKRPDPKRVKNTDLGEGVFSQLFGNGTNRYDIQKYISDLNLGARETEKFLLDIQDTFLLHNKNPLEYADSVITAQIHFLKKQKEEAEKLFFNQAKKYGQFNSAATSAAISLGRETEDPEKVARENVGRVIQAMYGSEVQKDYSVAMDRFDREIAGKEKVLMQRRASSTKNIIKDALLEFQTQTLPGLQTEFLAESERYMSATQAHVLELQKVQERIDSANQRIPGGPITSKVEEKSKLQKATQQQIKDTQENIQMNQKAIQVSKAFTKERLDSLNQLLQAAPEAQEAVQKMFNFPDKVGDEYSIVLADASQAIYQYVNTLEGSEKDVKDKVSSINTSFQSLVASFQSLPYQEEGIKLQLELIPKIQTAGLAELKNLRIEEQREIAALNTAISTQKKRLAGDSKHPIVAQIQEETEKFKQFQEWAKNNDVLNFPDIFPDYPKVKAQWEKFLEDLKKDKEEYNKDQIEQAEKAMKAQIEAVESTIKDSQISQLNPWQVDEKASAEIDKIITAQSKAMDTAVEDYKKRIEELKKQGIEIPQIKMDEDLRKLIDLISKDSEIKVKIVTEDADKAKSWTSRVDQAMADPKGFGTNMMKNGVYDAASGVEAMQVATNFTGMLTGGLQAASGAASAMAGAALSGIGYVQGAVQAAQTIVDLPVQFMQSIVTLLQSAADLPNVFDDLVNQIPELIPRAMEGIAKFFSESIPNLIDSIPDIIDGFIDGIPSIISSFISYVPKIAIALANAVAKMVGSSLDIAKGVAYGVYDGVKSGWYDVYKSGSDALFGKTTYKNNATNPMITAMFADLFSVTDMLGDNFQELTQSLSREDYMKFIGNFHSAVDEVRVGIESFSVSSLAFSVNELTRTFEEMAIKNHAIDMNLDKVMELYQLEIEALIKDKQKPFWDIVKDILTKRQARARVDWGMDEYTNVFQSLDDMQGGLDPSSITYWDDSLNILQDQVDILSSIENLQQEQVQELESSVDTYSQLIESFDDLIRELTGGSLAPVQSKEFFESEYERLKQNVLAEDLTSEQMRKAVEEYQSFSKDYLDFFAAYGLDYKTYSDKVLSDATAMRDIVSNLKTETELMLAAITSASNSNVGQLTILENNLLARIMGTEGLAQLNALNPGLASISMTISQMSMQASASASGIGGLIGGVATAINNQSWSITDRLDKLIRLQEVATGQTAVKKDGVWDVIEGGVVGGLVGGIGSVVGAVSKLKFWSTGGMVGADQYKSATGGARTTGGPGIAGEVGPEWIVPTYEPERTRFLSDVGADPNVIATRVANIIGPMIGKALSQMSGVENSGGGSTNVHVYIDGKEVSNAVVSRITSGDRNIRRALNKERSSSMSGAF